MPALMEMMEHPDLGLLEGYKFSESREDSIKKVVLLLDICESSLQSSPILTPIQEAMIEEIVTFSVEEFKSCCPSVAHGGFTGSEIESWCRTLYGLEMYEYVLVPYLTEMLTVTMNISYRTCAKMFSKIRFEGFKTGPHGLKKWMNQYLNDRITSEEFVSRLTMSKFDYHYIDATICKLIDFVCFEEYNEGDLRKILKLLHEIEEGLVWQNLLNDSTYIEVKLEASKLLCEFLLGEKGTEDVLLFLAQPKSLHETEALFIALLRRNQFNAAVFVIPDRISSEKSRKYVRNNANFLKYLYETNHFKLFAVAGTITDAWYGNSNLYVLMARRHPLAKALLQFDDSSQTEIFDKIYWISFEGICVEELLTIYNNALAHSLFDSHLFHEAFSRISAKLFAIKLRTLEGRKWILSQFRDRFNLSWQRNLLSFSKLIYKMSEIGGSITKYLLSNDYRVNCEAVIRDLEDPNAFAQNKQSLSDVFSLLPYSFRGKEEFPVAVFEHLNHERLERILELPGMNFERVAKATSRAENWFANLQIVAMEMLNREGERAVFEKLDLLYPLTSFELRNRISREAKSMGNDLAFQFSIKTLRYMNNYRKKVVLLTLAMYQENG